MAMDDAPLCRPPLVVNMDETAIVRHVSGLRGTVVKATSKTQVGIDRASLSDRRSCMSLLASITNDASIQAQLPQVLLGNHHTLTLQVLRSVGERIGSVSLWRQKSAWNSHCTMRRWLALLVKALGPVVKSRYVIVLLDVHPSHIHPSIFLQARRCGVRLVYLPGKLTSFLQPCDTHVFATFKHALRKVWLDEKSKAANGAISTEAWLQTVCDAIEKVIVGTSWRKAFLADGILHKQQDMSQDLVKALGFDSCVELPHVLPAEKEASCIFPARMNLDILGYLTWQTKAERKKKEVEAIALASESPTTAPTYKGRVIQTLN